MSTYKKLQVFEKNTNVRVATKMVEASLEDLHKAMRPDQILVRIHYTGINATDVNSFLGNYSGPNVKIPFDVGLEGLGEIVAKGSKAAPYLAVGMFVTYSAIGSFSEYQLVSSKQAIPVPKSDPRFLTLPVSALTASISIAECGRPKMGETALVTAAAGGTGQFAVQLFKAAGCTVIGTCSSESKAKFLRSIGCDRVVNYNAEKLGEVLRNEFPQGIDIVYESVGGETFEDAIRNMAFKGRLIIIGSISGYLDKTTFQRKGPPLQGYLMAKSVSLHGFMLFHYANAIPQHAPRLLDMISNDKLVCQLDTKPFAGVGQVADAVEHLHSGKSVGKVVVKLLENNSKV